jgi:hypothetical protein
MDIKTVQMILHVNKKENPFGDFLFKNRFSNSFVVSVFFSLFFVAVLDLLLYLPFDCLVNFQVSQ